jgi:hypothetical protein
MQEENEECSSDEEPKAIAAGEPIDEKAQKREHGDFESGLSEGVKPEKKPGAGQIVFEENARGAREGEQKEEEAEIQIVDAERVWIFFLHNRIISEETYFTMAK